MRGLPMVMADSGPGLMTSPPVGPAQPVGVVVHGAHDQGDEHPLDLIAGERDQLLRSGVPGMLVGTDGSEEGVGEHGEGDPCDGQHIARAACLSL